MSAPAVIDLRRLLSERFPRLAPAAASFWPTGLPLLDDLSGGGLPKGAVTEVATPFPAGGSSTLLRALLHQAQREATFLALIDGTDSFDPEGCPPAALPHLLWMRCQRATEAMKAADFILRDGNFPIVVLDLVLNSATELRKIPATTWYRFQRLVEPFPVVFTVLVRQSMVSSAQIKLTLTEPWQLDDLAAEEDQAFRLRFQQRRGVHGALRTG